MLSHDGPGRSKRVCQWERITCVMEVISGCQRVRKSSQHRALPRGAYNSAANGGDASYAMQHGPHCIHDSDRKIRIGKEPPASDAKRLFDQQFAGVFSANSPLIDCERLPSY